MRLPQWRRPGKTIQAVESSPPVMSRLGPGAGQPRCDVGTVVLVHDGRRYEVAFMTLDGQTGAVVSLAPEQVRRVGPGEIACPRAVPGGIGQSYAGTARSRAWQRLHRRGRLELLAGLVAAAEQVGVVGLVLEQLAEMEGGGEPLVVLLSQGGLLLMPEQAVDRFQGEPLLALLPLQGQVS